MSNLKYTNLPSEASNEDALAQLALDVSYSWNDTAGALWQRLNPELWELTRNPWVVLQTVSGAKLQEIHIRSGVSKDPGRSDPGASSGIAAMVPAGSPQCQA